MSKRVDVLNLQQWISETNVIKKILSLLNVIDVELVMMAHNKNKKISKPLWFLKGCAIYGYTDLLFLYIDNNTDKKKILKSAARGGYETFEAMVKKYDITVNYSHHYIMAYRGHLNLLKTFKPLLNGGEMLYVAAVEGGHFDVLKYLRYLGCRWDERTTATAAHYGHFEILKWAVENGCPWNGHVVIHATDSGHLDILKWAIDKRCPFINHELIGIAIRKGHLHILEWIRDHLGGIGYIDEDVMQTMVEKGKLEIAKWISENYRGYQHKARFCTIAAKWGQLEMLQWLRSQGCEWNAKKVCLYLAKGGHSVMLLWARAHGGVWTKKCYEYAIENGHSKTAEMLIENEMERGQKRQKSLRSRFKYSFNGIQGHVPIEIWIRHILLVTDLQSLSNMAQTSKPFKEIVHENVRINNWELARRYRKEGQIPLALKCLKSCVEHNHPEATFHLGYAYIKGGWGVGTYDCELSKEYFNRALELGYERALVYLTDIQKFDPVAFNITDSFALGYFCFCHQDNYLTKAFQYFQDSAQKGDEFGQYYLGYMYFHELGTERNTFKAVEWFTRSAEQGHCVAQKALANIKRDPKWLLKTKRQKTLW